MSRAEPAFLPTLPGSCAERALVSLGGATFAGPLSFPNLDRLQPVGHHVSQPGGAHLVVHQQGYQLVDAGGAGGDAGKTGAVPPRLLHDANPVVLKGEPRALLLIHREIVSEGPAAPSEARQARVAILISMM